MELDLRPKNLLHGDRKCLQNRDLFAFKGDRWGSDYTHATEKHDCEEDKNRKHKVDECGDRFWRRTLRAGLGSNIGNRTLDSATVEDGQYADDWEEDISQGRIEDVHRIGEEVSELSADEGVIDASLLVFTLVACDGFAFAVAGDHFGEGDGKHLVKESEQTSADKEEDRTI